MTGLEIGWIGLGVALLLLTLFVALRARDLWTRTGLPAGKVLYSDTADWLPLERPLRDRDLGLTGRPDYLVREADGMIIPVELKSGQAPDVPHEGHILQLAAYCALVAATFKIRPTYGILQYSDRAFAVDYTPDLEEDLLVLLDEIDEAREAGALDRDHDEPRRCARCGFRNQCDQRLA